ELGVDPVEEPVDHRLGLGEPVCAACLADELCLTDVLLYRVELADHLQCLRRPFGLDRLGLEEFSSRVRPALRAREPAFLCVTFVGRVAVGEQHRPLGRWVGPQGLRNVFATTPLVIGEADFVALAIHGPEVAALHLPRAGAPGLDRGLSIALMRLARIESSWAVKTGSSSASAAWVSCVSHGRETRMPLSPSR